jgi:hypothetical protein
MANDVTPQRDFIFYDKAELRGIIRAFKGLTDEAQTEAKNASSALAQYAGEQIKAAAGSAPNPNVAKRIAEGFKVSKSSKIGELSFGFAGQKFSGGATTQFNPGKEGGNGLLAGAEFGADIKERTRSSGTYEGYKQFPPRSPRRGRRGNEGYFIYPTLRKIQPELIKQWEESFSKIVKEWNK